MSLGQHLVELRKRLTRGALAIVAGTVGGWFLYDLVWALIRDPITRIAAASATRTPARSRSTTPASPGRSTSASRSPSTIGIVISARSGCTRSSRSSCPG